MLYVHKDKDFMIQYNNYVLELIRVV